MRIVAVEEHFTFPYLLDRIDLATLDRNGWPAPGTATFKAINPPALADTGRERIAAMDAAGIRMQVLSVPPNSSIDRHEDSRRKDWTPRTTMATRPDTTQDPYSA